MEGALVKFCLVHGWIHLGGVLFRAKPDPAQSKQSRANREEGGTRDSPPRV